MSQEQLQRKKIISFKNGFIGPVIGRSSRCCRRGWSGRNKSSKPSSTCLPLTSQTQVDTTKHPQQKGWAKYHYSDLLK